MRRKQTRKQQKPTRKTKPTKPTTAATGAVQCACGCGAEVNKRNRFRQGHDARMRPNSKWLREHPELEAVIHG